MINLPTLFEQKLSSSPILLAGVRRTLDLFEPWIEQSGMPFFPGFTDHSPRHINDVLSTAASMMSDSSHTLLSSEDVAVLCMAILLHDCGMHVTQDMFRELMIDDSPPIVSGFGDIKWSLLWADFLSEAGRFGQEKLIAIFGDSRPILIESIKFDDLGERDCLLIGEFVRRHHTRIAHEIALKGIHRSGGIPLELSGFDSEFRDLSGLIARSHGMSIRSTFDYISSKFGLIQSFREVKVPYLMAVLRIADYVQVKSERAIRTLLSVKELRSPVSKQEWKAHFAVHDVSTRHADPEALYVHANPTDVRTYLKLKWLFKDIQRELDESWSTLGEVYGRQAELAMLGLSIRRIKSNLDNVESFSKNVSFIPLKAGFDSSGPDLLKLLVGPLYDYKYEVGIRELVQNSVDACREFFDIRKGKSLSPNSGSVTVEIEESNDRTGWVTITDTGVGMTLETIRDYFLIAGASFRNSDVWKKQHIDESGNARISRGGRFGVGALAAFLLGDQITVTTRHIDRRDTDGIEFTARIDDPIIELHKCSAPAGTMIRVWISNPEVFDSLRPEFEEDRNNQVALENWDAANWFRQSAPSVVYQWNGFRFSSTHPNQSNRDSSRIKAEYRVSNYQFVPLIDEDSKEWKVLENVESYQKILWSFASDAAKRFDGEEFPSYPVWEEETAVVNGIFIQGYDDHRRQSSIKLSPEQIRSGPEYWLRRPSLAIFDSAGVCPLNLQRSAIAFERMGIEESLAGAVIVDHFNFISDSVRNIFSFKDFSDLAQLARKRPTVEYSGQLVPLIVTKTGVSLLIPSILSEMKITRLYFLSADSNITEKSISTILTESEALVIRTDVRRMSIQADLMWFRAIVSGALGGYKYTSETGLPEVACNIVSGRLSEKTWGAINERGKIRRGILDSIFSKKTKNDVVIFSTTTIQSKSLTIRRLASFEKFLDPSDDLFVWDIVPKPSNVSSSDLLLKSWITMFETTEVPLLKTKRNKSGSS